MKIFDPLVAEEQLHPNFKRTLEPGAAGIRAILEDWSHGFEDRDGKFIQEFQRTYNSSFWELYLFAVLKDLNLPVDFRHASPDFVLQDYPVVIEATVANHSVDGVPEWEKTFDGVTDDDLMRSYTNAIVRASNAFLGKERKYRDSYANLPHVDGKQFVIAIANFGTEDFFMLGDVAMQWLLYDMAEVGEVHKTNGAAVPLGIFKDDQFAHVSAVAYSSTATFGKARALGTDAGDFLFNAVRIKDNVEPIRIVSRKEDYQESLTDGLRIFTNPNANYPLDLSLFNDPGIRVFEAHKDGTFHVSCHPEGDLCMRMVVNLITE